MAVGDVETYWEDGWWRNRIEGGEAATGVYPVRAVAAAVGRAMALSRHVAHVTLDERGDVIERDDFRRDSE